MSCPCGLTREEVFKLADNKHVPLKDGLCQNKFRKPDGSLGICESTYGEHPTSQGKEILLMKYQTKNLFSFILFEFLD